MADVTPSSRCDGTGEMKCHVCSGTSDPSLESRAASVRSASTRSQRGPGGWPA